MNLLLDTCAFLWIISGDAALSQNARDIFRDPANTVFLSAVSVWEIAVKHSIGKLDLPEKPDRFIPKQRRLHGIEALALEEAAAAHVTRLPALHGDPFDRMLVSQAIVHGMTILTPDEAIARYPVLTAWD